MNRWDQCGNLKIGDACKNHDGSQCLRTHKDVTKMTRQEIDGLKHGKCHDFACQDAEPFYVGSLFVEGLWLAILGPFYCVKKGIEAQFGAMAPLILAVIGMIVLFVVYKVIMLVMYVRTEQARMVTGGMMSGGMGGGGMQMQPMHSGAYGR